MDQIAMAGSMTRIDKFIFISILICGALIIMTAIYGTIARFFIIPDKDSRIKVLEMRIETYQEIVKQKDDEINNLKLLNKETSLSIRWDKFLQLMLDKDTRVRFDYVEKYLKKNRIGLYEPLGVGG